MRYSEVLVLLLLLPASASAQYVRLDFQDALPFTMEWPSGSRDVTEIGNPGPCGDGVWWDRTRVAPGSGNGGYMNRGYVRITWCDYDVSRSGDAAHGAGWTESGYRFEPGGSSTIAQRNWPDILYGRFRIYVERPIVPHLAAGGDIRRQLKFFIWHTEVYDGDQRVIGFLENGGNCGQSDDRYICFTLQRNINHLTDTATVAIPLNIWSHLQFSWKHGTAGTSYLKIWRDNNNEGLPTAQDLSLTAVPARPGGTSTWLKEHAGYDAGFSVGNAVNSGTRFSEDFVYRLMDFELAGTFDSRWAPGTSTAAPAAPTNVRIAR